jgi:ATP-dependent Clp protease ATP-binding subunit ClpA
MGISFDPRCQAAIDLAKSALPSKSAALDVDLLMSALYHATQLRKRVPELAGYLSAPKARRQVDAGDKVPLAEPLKAILKELMKSHEERPLSAEELFTALAESTSGRRLLISRGLAEPQLDALLRTLRKLLASHGGAEAEPEAEALRPRQASGWRSSAARKEAVEALSPFGRMLTQPSVQGSDEPEVLRDTMDKPLASLVRSLSKMKRRNVIIIGHPGTGKSALVRELARRMLRGDESIPEPLRDKDIFELVPAFLRSGASVVGQYDERVKSLIQVLEAHPDILLFVDEIHSLLHSGIYERGPFTEANESFKGALGAGTITCIGCTTPAEYRHYIEPDGALARRFNILRLEPPSFETTLQILEARRPRMERYFKRLSIPAPILRRAVELTDEYLTGRQQPDKSIQLLDEACAFCITARPPLPEVTEEALARALEDMVGHGVIGTRRLSEEEVYERLRRKLVGQDEVLRGVARGFVAGLGGWSRGSGPRGVFLFGGPTGVGKTETAVLLAEVLGGGRDSLVRVDCSTLQGSGYDSRPAQNRLLGPPPGYLGYARGQGGILSRVRDLPESVILFDEFEKADPGVGQLLLRILDEGRLEDVDGNVLDFRRSFIVLTTNAGARYGKPARTGFGLPGGERPERPTVDAEAVLAGLRATGLGEEFLGRIDHVFLFQSLEPEAIREVVGRQLERLRRTAEDRGLHMDWEPELVSHLLSQWQPRFGVRALSAMLHNRVIEQLSVAEAQGELEDVTGIHLDVLEKEVLKKLADLAKSIGLAGLATRERQDKLLVIALA